MRSYNWGIIGPGDIAHDFANDLKLVNNAQKITAVLSHRQESANAFADEFNIEKRFLNIEDFINDGKVEIAYIATPHPQHYEEIKWCLKNKIAVLCEKPIVLNHDQYVELLNLSKENNTFLMEGMWIRFLPVFQKLMDLVSEKKIGEIIHVKAGMYFRAPRDKDNRFFDPGKGGGSLLDLGVYCVFLSTLLLGAPESIKAIGRLTEDGIDEACAMLLSYSNGRYSILESSLLKDQNTPAEIHGTEGMIRILDPWFEKSPGLEVVMHDGKKEEYPQSWIGHGFQFEIEEVIRCLEAGKIESHIMPGELSLQVLKIMDQVREDIHVRYDHYE